MNATNYQRPTRRKEATMDNEPMTPDEAADARGADAEQLFRVTNDPMLELFRMTDGDVNMDAYLRWTYLGLG